MVIFDTDRKRMIYIDREANSKFWDQLWMKNRKADLSTKFDLLVVPNTKKYLKKGSKILEGGCGHGTHVIHLVKYGYQCCGVDYAKNTIRTLKKAYPKLDFRIGDVTNLPFDNGYFDGYWSLGVIEHFWNGYLPIVSEMRRVVRKGGYVFVTFPYMSPLRKYKARWGKYPQEKFHTKPKDFYQFALNHKQVIDDFTREGFELISKKPYDGVAGLRKEASGLRFFLKPLSYYSTKSLIAASLRFLLSKSIESFSSHAILLVFKKVN